MATSGSFDYSLTAADIIKSAYEDLGVISPGESVGTNDQTMAMTRLNMLVKQLQGDPDISPWLKILSRRRITLALAKGQQSYLVGPASTDSRASTQMGRTTLSGAEAAGQTVLSITSNTDATTYPGTTLTMTNGDIIGIQLDDGTIQWTTISGTPSTTATVADALTSAAASGNYVWWFTSRAQRFTTLESAVLREATGTDTPLMVYRDVRDYEQGVSDKYADGDPTAILVEPLRINTRITLNSQPTNVAKQIIFTALYPAEDYDATTDDIAFPQECFLFLSWELAFLLSASYGRWTQEMDKNRATALARARAMNPEVSSLYFQPG